MSKRKNTVHNVALELCQERMRAAEALAAAQGKVVVATEENFYPAAIDFVLRARRATW